MAHKNTMFTGAAPSRHVERNNHPASGGHNPIHIQPSHEGELTREVGKKGLTTANLTKGIATAKKSGNVKLEREEVFAKNEKGWRKG